MFLLSLLAFTAGIQAVNVTYDSRAIIIDGKRKLLVGGCIHYPRSTPEMWPSLLKLAKQGGLDIIETYVFWNIHEPVRGQYDFSGRFDLIRYFKEVQKAGLFVNLRIGPYVCAEWNFGGFPVWLREIPNIVFRTNNEPYKQEMKRWVDYLVKYLSDNKMFAPQGGPIILSQIENEYGNIESSYGADGKKYVEWCGQYAQSLNIGVPWIMCQQGDAPTGIINTCNGFYCDGFEPNQPNVPVIWTENWPGWFQDWGEPIPKRPAEDVAFSMARFYARGGVYGNYYMYHGGTNFERTAGGPFIITSYDYDVMIDEYGLVQNPKYTHSQQLHDIIHKYEDLLTNLPVPQPISLGKDLEAHVYESSSGCLAFLSNIGHDDATVTFRGKSYPLPGWSVSLAQNCKDVIYNTATISAPTEVKEMKPLAPTLAQVAWESWSETPGAWGSTVYSPQPLEQVATTKDQTDYLWYLYNFTHPGGSGRLWVMRADDVLHVLLNKKYIGTFQQQADLQLQFAAGRNDLQLLSVSMGLVNYGAFLELRRKGVTANITLDGDVITYKGWQHQVGTRGENLQLWTTAGQAKVTWSKATAGTPLTWYRTTFDAPSGEAPLGFDLTSMGKGYIWVNGYNLGRYWTSKAPPNVAAKNATGMSKYEARAADLKDLVGVSACDACDYRGSYNPSKCRSGCGDVSQRWYHIPREWVKATGNSLVLFEEVGGDPTGVTLVQRQPGVVCASIGEDYGIGGPQNAQLECQPPTKIAKVDFAQFGTPTGQCRHFIAGSCGAKNSTSVVESLCLGKASCSIPSSVDFFGDPCPTVTKRLNVQITCA